MRHQFAFQIRASKLAVVQYAEVSRKEGKSKQTLQSKKAEERRKKRQRSEEPGVCLPSRPPSPFPDLCYVDATPGAVEGAGEANDVSVEQLMGGCPASAASPPPGELWLGLGSLLSCLIERNLRLVIGSPLA